MFLYQFSTYCEELEPNLRSVKSAVNHCVNRIGVRFVLKKGYMKTLIFSFAQYLLIQYL